MATTDSKLSMDRRRFLKASLGSAALLPMAGALLLPRGARADDDKLVTEIEANATMVQALGYVDPSPKPDQDCKGCQLYTAGAGGRGKCQLFPAGVVSETGWCMSFAPKVS